MKSLRRMLVVMLLAVAASALSAAPALAAKKHHQKVSVKLTPGSTYLALGDSVTFGYEESNVVPAPDYTNAASFLGYPEHVGAGLHVKVVNAACPGETSSSLIDPNAQSNGCENAPGTAAVSYRKLFPLHVHYTGSQLAFAVKYLRGHRHVRLVSLMIGANDYFVCVETSADGCTAPAEQQAVLAKITQNVKVILNAIRHKAHYTGQLAIVHYYALNYASAATIAQSQQLNAAQDAGARPFHVIDADGFGLFGDASAHSAGSPCTAGLLTQLGTPDKCGVHPSYAGQALLAEAVERAVRL